MRNMSGASVAGLDREVAQQVGLQRLHAEDEEGAEADGEQDDARLVARPRDVQHGLAQRERARVAQRLHGAHQRQPGQVQDEGDARRIRRQQQADAHRARLPRRHADQRRGHDRCRHAPT